MVSENKRIHYRVLEYYGTCFSIEFTLTSTNQNWTVFVPSSKEISYLLRIWHAQAKPENSIKLGEWMRRAKLSFDEDVITGRYFRHKIFQKEMSVGGKSNDRKCGNNCSESLATLCCSTIFPSNIVSS